MLSPMRKVPLHTVPLFWYHNRHTSAQAKTSNVQGILSIRQVLVNLSWEVNYHTWLRVLLGCVWKEFSVHLF